MPVQPAPRFATSTRNHLPRACATPGTPPTHCAPPPADPPEQDPARGIQEQAAREALRGDFGAGSRRGQSLAGWLQQTRRGVGTKREGTSAPPLPRDRPEPLRELRPCALAREGWKGGLATGVVVVSRARGSGPERGPAGEVMAPDAPVSHSASSRVLPRSRLQSEVREVLGIHLQHGG